MSQRDDQNIPAPPEGSSSKCLDTSAQKPSPKPGGPGKAPAAQARPHPALNPIHIGGGVDPTVIQKTGPRGSLPPPSDDTRTTQMYFFAFKTTDWRFSDTPRIQG